MLPPKPRLLSVIENVDESQTLRPSRTDKRYPHRRGLDRATQSFVIYLLVARQFADLGESGAGAPVDRAPVTTPESGE